MLLSVGTSLDRRQQVFLFSRNHQCSSALHATCQRPPGFIPTGVLNARPWALNFFLFPPLLTGFHTRRRRNGSKLNTFVRDLPNDRSGLGCPSRSRSPEHLRIGSLGVRKLTGTTPRIHISKQQPPKISAICPWEIQLKCAIHHNWHSVSKNRSYRPPCRLVCLLEMLKLKPPPSPSLSTT